MTWKTYRLTLTYSTGRHRLTIPAPSQASAIRTVMIAEGCPRRAIVKVECLGRKAVRL